MIAEHLSVNIRLEHIQCIYLVHLWTFHHAKEVLHRTIRMCKTHNHSFLATSSSYFAFQKFLALTASSMDSPPLSNASSCILIQAEKLSILDAISYVVGQRVTILFLMIPRKRLTYICMSIQILGNPHKGWLVRTGWSGWDSN